MGWGFAGLGFMLGLYWDYFCIARDYIVDHFWIISGSLGITLGERAGPSVCFIGGYYGSHYFINIRHLLTFLVSGVLFFTIVCMWKMAVVLPLLVHDVTTPHHTTPTQPNAPRGISHHQHPL